MPEEITTTEITGAIVEPASAGTTSYLVGEDGNFVDGFRDKIDESIRNEKSLEGFTNINQILKSYVATKKMVGSDTIKLPGKNSTPAEVEAFYNSLGRPEKPDGYKLDYPQDMPVEENPNLRSAWLAEAHKLGYTSSQAAGAYTFYNNMVREGLALQEQQQETEVKEAENVLRQKWGQAYDERIHLANKMITDNVDGDIKEHLLAKIGNDPIVADFLANIAKNFTENNAASGAASTKMTPAEANSEMLVKIEERAKITDKNSETYKRLCREINALAASSIG